MADLTLVLVGLLVCLLLILASLVTLIIVTIGRYGEWRDGGQSPSGRGEASSPRVVALLFEDFKRGRLSADA